MKRNGQPRLRKSESQRWIKGKHPSYNGLLVRIDYEPESDGLLGIDPRSYGISISSQASRDRTDGDTLLIPGDLLGPLIDALQELRKVRAKLNKDCDKYWSEHPTGWNVEICPAWPGEGSEGV